jgi:hypothetical protein
MLTLPGYHVHVHVKLFKNELQTAISTNLDAYPMSSNLAALENGGVFGDDACNHHYTVPPTPRSVLIFYSEQKIRTF